MTDEKEVTQNEDEQVANTVTERETLERQAKMLGVEYHPSLGIDKLRDRVKAKLQEEFPDAALIVAAPAPVAVAPVPETTLQKNKRLKLAANKLVRIQIACMNPNKGEWEGEVFTAGNSVVGTLSKYVPYNVDWHVPQIILNMIDDRKCQLFYTATDDKGRKYRKGRMAKEYTVSILPDLSTEELHDLAQRQAIAKGTAAA
jgi:hypothetical protein